MRYLTIVATTFLCASTAWGGFGYGRVVGGTPDASGGGAINYGNETAGGVLLATDSVNTLYLYPLSETVSASGTLQNYTVNVRASSGTRKLSFALYKVNGSNIDLITNSATATSGSGATAYTAAADFGQLSFTPLGSASVSTGDYYIGMRAVGYPKVAGTASGGSGYTYSLPDANAWPSSLAISSLTSSSLLPGKWYITVQ